MTILARGDGTQFVIQAYRENLNNRKRSVLIKRIRHLASQHGRFVHIAKRDNALEAVFSSESGFLLAESIQAYFGFPENLIVAIDYPEKEGVLLVVIREGNIYLDTLIPKEDLNKELAALFVTPVRYRVFLFGNVLVQKDDLSNFYLPAEYIDTLEVSDDDLLEKLTTLGKTNLLPLHQALKISVLSSSWQLKLILIGMLTLLLLGWFCFHKSPHLVSRPTRSHILKIVSNPYAAYFKALKSASPNDKLHDVAYHVQQLLQTPGWDLRSIDVTGDEYVISFKSQDVELASLEKWLLKHHYQMKLNGNALIAKMKANLKKRQMISHKIYPLQQMLAVLLDQLRLMFGKNAVVLRGVSSSGHVQEAKIVINFTDVSRIKLLSLSDELRHLPIVVTNVHLRVNKTVLSGTVHLSLWGK